MKAKYAILSGLLILVLLAALVGCAPVAPVAAPEKAQEAPAALPDYIPFGAALAETAKRSLEDPPIFYGKKKDDEDEDE